MSFPCPAVRLPRRRPGALAAACAAALLALLAGCGAGVPEQAERTADPLQLVRILPTRPGLVPASPPRSVDAGGLARALVGGGDAGLAAAMREQGLERAAVRTWRGPGGAELVVATSLWKESQGAVGFGGQAAERLLDRPGASAWTPSDFGGGRGARVGPPQPARALSYAVGRTGLFVRASGPVGDAPVLRTMQLLAVAARGEDESG